VTSHQKVSVLKQLWLIDTLFSQLGASAPFSFKKIMAYIEQTLDKINEVLLENGCGLYQPDLIEIGNIISDVIVGANLDSSLAAEAVDWINTHREGKNNDITS
jgi:hypothetical protein